MPHGILLTGGASPRLGTDKASLMLNGVPLAVRAGRVLRAVCDLAVEVGPGVSGLTAVRENPPGTGPLCAFSAGLAALAAGRVGAAKAGDDDVLLLAADMPYVEAPLLELLARWDAPGAAVVPVAAGRMQSLCARYPAGVAGTVDALVATGTRSMHALLGALRVVEVEARVWEHAAPAHAFSDIDTPDDLRAVRAGGAQP